VSDSDVKQLISPYWKTPIYELLKLVRDAMAKYGYAVECA